MLASTGKIKEWVTELFVNYVIKTFTFDNFKAVITKLANLLQEKAQATETFIDDWAVDFIISIAIDDEKLQKFYTWIKSYVLPTEDGVVKALPFTSNVKELATELTASKDQTVKAIDINAIVELLQIIVPLLIELFSKKEN